MADLITRILLDDKQFNDNIAKSKQKTESFDKAFGTIKSSVTKFAGALGIATTAGATFMKIIESSDSKSDNFQNTMNAAKTSVDQFFKSIATGDFSSFINGLDDVYKKAWATQAALDQLGDTQLSFSLVSSKTRSKIAGARADAFDTELSAEERKKAIKDWKDGINEIGEATKVLQNDINAVMQTTASTFNALLPENIDPAEIERILAVNANENRDAIKDKAAADFKAYQDELKSIAKANRESITIQTTAGAVVKSVVSEEGKRLQTEAAGRYKEAILTHSIWEKMTETERKGLQELTSQYYSLNEAISSNEMQINRAIPRLEKQISKGATGGGVKVEILPSGSLTELEKQIQEARKSFLNATTDEARAAADILIKDLEARKAIVSIQFKYGDLKDVGAGGNHAKVKGIDYEAFKNIDMSGVRQSFEDVKTWNELMSDMAEKNRKTIDSFNGVSSAIGNIGSALDNEAGAWLQWGANVVGSIGQAIPAIAALTTAKSAEATANTASAASGAASSVASIPVVGPVMAVAAIASIVAALASVPKFAYGGIVPGNSFSGDNVLARVNSGEMILPTGLQSNLFNMIKVGGSARGSNSIEVTGELVAKGTNLVAAIGNLNAKRSRI